MGVVHPPAPPRDEAVQWLVEAEAEEHRRKTGAYSRDSRSSYFRDLLLEAESEQRARAALENPRLRGHDQGDPGDAAADAGLADARKRLQAFRDIGGQARPELGQHPRFPASGERAGLARERVRARLQAGRHPRRRVRAPAA